MNEKDIEQIPQSSEEKLLQTLAEKYQKPAPDSTWEDDLNVFQSENNSKTKITNLDREMQTHFLKKITED